MKFNGNLLLIGCGSVAQCTLPLILRHIDMPASKITVMDLVDNRALIKDLLDRGVKYVRFKITPDNYKKTLAQYAGPGDLIVDLAYDIETNSLLQWCHDHDVHYVNTSVELWAAYHGSNGRHPTEYTLYTRQMAMRKMIAGWEKKPSATAVVDHGANPGLVSHFAKKALIDIAQKIIKEKPADKRRWALEKALTEQSFSQLAMLEGIKVIHISERDTQITSKPKEINEFVNTWSIAGLYEEGVAPAEMGWGTHEKRLPTGALTHKEGPRNQICLTTKGMHTWVRSWVPCGEITGMVIRHGEAFSISDKLTVWEDGRAVYRPTVHYAYCPSDVTINSLHELEMRQFELQPRQRIMTDEIISGRDELGCLLMGHDFSSWWIGSLLDIEETRRLVPHQNATTLQVAISVVSAVRWMLANPRMGVCVPDDLPHEPILKDALPYLGPFISQPVDWTPLKDRKNLVLDYGAKQPGDEDVWQFTTFLISPRGVDAPRTITREVESTSR